MLKESFRMSWQNIRANKMRTFLTMLGIIIGVTAIIALITTMEGATGEITSQFEAMGAGKVSVSVSGTPLKRGLNDAEVARIASLDNISGVDPNLQYPAGWDQAREIKFAQGFVSPAPRDYVGTAPLVAPESRALYDYTLSYSPALTLSYHTQGNVIYWKFLDYNPPDAYAIGLRFSAASSYALESTPYASGFAGYKDWYIQNYNRPGYTIEAGLGQNPLPIDRFDGIYADNLGILTLGLQALPN